MTQRSDVSPEEKKDFIYYFFALCIFYAVDCVKYKIDCVKSTNMYKRPEYQVITKHLKASRRFIQVEMGAQQVGNFLVSLHQKFSPRINP